MVDLDSTLSSGVRHTWKTLFSVGDTLLIKTQFVRRLPSQHNPRCWEIFFTALIRSGGLGRAEYRGSSKQTVARSVKMPEQISRISVEGPAVAANGIAHQNVNSEPDKQATVKGPVCVTGAAGYVGSWLIMRLLEQGYTVRATVRDPGIPIKTKHLLDLPEADKRLTLWKADLDEEGSFDAAIDGCEGVFHVATPMDFESQDPENEVIKPCINGVLNVMRSCAKAKSVKRVVFTSSAGTVDLTEHQYPGQVFDETNWSDVQFCRRVKMTGWMYFVSKTLAEKAAWEFAEEKKLDLITIIPTLVVGPFIMQTMPPSMITALSLITRNESHYHIIKNAHLVHLDDLCIAHIFLYEHPQAKGRYICSSESTTIIEVAKMLARKYPEYNVPTEFEDVDEKVQPVQFSSKKLIGLGFEFKYTVEDMFDGAIQSCRERKLL